MKIPIPPFTALFLLAGGALAQDASFYKEPPLFSHAPDPTKPIHTIERFGPVGIGIELLQPAFTMRIKNVEPGSPAEATGALKPGQFIETVNGSPLKDIDPRIQLGNVITDAEASDGVIRLRVADKPGGQAQEVIVKIPVLGAYSKTWPLNCPKSDKIVRDFAGYIAKPGTTKGFSGIGMLFLLGTGEDQDLLPVRDWVRSLADLPAPGYSWHLGYGGIPLCEYYLRTGDEAALPVIQKWVDSAVSREYLGGWSQRGIVGSPTYGPGGGHLNAGGTAVVTFLMLAKECGADIPEDSLTRVLTHFYRWAGRGLVPYGDNRPEYGFVDNGKNGNLAFAMAAAAALTPDGEKSVYARARDIAAKSGFYSTSYMLHGHTGGGIGEIWRSAAMGLLHDKEPAKYRDFMDHRRWHYELSRRFDGSFGILGGARYDNEEWGAGYALTYIIPRKTLRITGAPPTEFSKPYQLPEHPWGTKADEAFLSLEPAAYADGTRPDFSGETMARDLSMAVLRQVNREDVDDATLRRYAHHPDSGLRFVAARNVMGHNSNHLSGRPTAGGEIRADLAMELFHSPDPRVRRAILHAMHERLGNQEQFMSVLGQKGFDKLIEMLSDPEESLWVKDAALLLISRAPTEPVVPHVDLILGFLNDKERWLRHAALIALTPVVADERCYPKIFPVLAEILRTTNQIFVTSTTMSWAALGGRLNRLPPNVQKVWDEHLRNAFANYDGEKRAASGMDVTRLHNWHLEHLAGRVASMENGYDILYQISKERFPDNPFHFKNIFRSANTDKFGPELKKAYEPWLRDQLIPQFIGDNRATLLSEADNIPLPLLRHNGGAPISPMDQLAKLYKDAGVDGHGWHDFGPNRNEMQWNYTTFDPPEKMAKDIARWTYRNVTVPPGMEDWHLPSFNPASAGWKRGLQPFGQRDGQLAKQLRKCGNIHCRCNEPQKTLWDKEVLLLNGKFQFPKFRKGHRYRLVVGGMSHVGAGNGFRVYLNGKQVVEHKQGLPGRPSFTFFGVPHIGKDMWPEFEREVTISAMGFLAYGDRPGRPTNPEPMGHFSIWLQEMKMPTIGEEEIRQSILATPMLTSDWQALQDPERETDDPDEGKFLWDGKFAPNAKILGSWSRINLVDSVDDFTPGMALTGKLRTFTNITFKDQGQTGDKMLIWSGNVLMNLSNNQAQQMEIKTIEGTDYLFIENGGFNTRNAVGWQSPWNVFKREGK